MVAAVDRLEAGTVIDGFRVVRCVHSGAMGQLFEVTREGDAAPMVMKVPRFGIADSNELLLAFETEAMILQRLRDAYSPRFVAAGDVTRVPYIVTEYIAGRSLDRRERPRIAVEELAPLAARIADALHAVHIQGVVHHDLKPDNVMVKPDGHAVLIDFGLAHHRDLPDLIAEERRFAAGSAPYVSSEQVRRRPGDPRSDLFALAVMMYELATGELPFGVPMTAAGTRDRLWRRPVPPRALANDMPPWMQEVILRCLEPEADRRYQSAAHVAFDLRHPGQVVLTSRAIKLKATPVLSQVVRWWRSRELGVQGGAAPETDAHVVMVAVDTMHPDDLRQPELQRATRRMLSIAGEYRLICVSVIPGGPGVNVGQEVVDSVREHRIRLRHWVDPLEVPPERISLHVIEAADPANALLEFAHANHVDLIVLGAPAPNEMRFAWWRSVASTVTANADCTVHVVRRG
ncbi:MAG: serine/threonine protein kinase [Betaproteobacteria bacterium]